jgi:hypothetical protein
MQTPVRVSALSLGLALGLVAVSPASFAQSTTRIEPRPVYGATVTIEEGVRVFRPLPPERHVIINPNGTPLNLSLSETKIIQHSTAVSRNVHTHRYNRSPYYRSFIPAVGGY